MHERTSRHSEAVRAGTPVTVGRLTLLPIERVVLHASQGEAGCWLSAAKQPYALVLRDAAGMRAFDTQAAAISIEGLCKAVPGLDVLLLGM